MTAELTKGEKRAFKTYCTAETHDEAARALQISTQTLKNHLGAIYRKLDRHKAHSALYRMCLEAGFDPFATLQDESTVPDMQQPEANTET